MQHENHRPPYFHTKTVSMAYKIVKAANNDFIQWIDIIEEKR